MFQDLDKLRPDAILGLMTLYRSDPASVKVDLGVGVFRDPDGNTPILDCVRAAEQTVLRSQSTKSYVAAVGRVEFNEAVESLVLGPASCRKDGRVRSAQTPGGCGALRVAAELIRAAAPRATVHVSDPTWGNHVPLLGSSGLKLARYPYYDTERRELCFEDMRSSLERAAPGDVVLIHACCHNPTGADLSPPQWESLAQLMLRRGLTPLLDLAYQGFGADLRDDAAGIRQMVDSLPEALIAVSFSKNLGLYRERVGALVTVSGSPPSADAVHSHVLQIARSIYSMPPDHGAAIAAAIFSDPALERQWERELAAMRTRIVEMRALLAARLRATTRGAAFDFLGHQRGLFSLLGVAPAVVEELRARHHIYLLADSRMNIAGITPKNVDYVAEAIAAGVR